MLVTYVPVLRFRMSRAADFNKNSSRDSACFSPPHNKGPLPRFLSPCARASVRRRACGVIFCCPMPPPKTSRFPHQNFPHQNQELTRWSGAVLSLRLSRKCHKNEKRPRLRARRASCPRRTQSRSPAAPAQFVA